MSKLNEMWAALIAYQPQANAEGYGETWAKMCKEKTATAAANANAAAAADYAAANASSDYAAANAASDYAAANANANVAAAYAAYAGVNYAEAEKWAQRAIDKINKVFVKHNAV